MENYFLSPNKEKRQWELKKENSEEILITHQFKRLALKRTVQYIREKANTDHPISLKIKKANGEIQEERTYPKSKDPKKSKG